MIISGLQTGNTRWLAAHLQNAADNDAIEIAEVTGAIAADIDGALAEFEAIAVGTKATEGVYAAFINPPEPLTREQYARAFALLEERLGFVGQPRIIVFHVKKGREHCHIVWSRVDAKRMKAIHLSYDRQKLRRCAQELAAEFGTPLPPGLAEDRGAARFDGPKPPSRAEKAMEERSGLSRGERRRAITACYRHCDSASSFASALEEAGYTLARGDKRVYVVVDLAGDVHSLARQIDGAKTRDVKKKLEGLNLADLPPVERAKALMLRRAAARQDARRECQKKKARAKAARERLQAVQRKRRAALDLLWQAMKIRHMHEWKVLLAHIEAEKERKTTRRRRRAVGLALYLKKIAFIRQLVEYYEKRRRRFMKEQHTALMASVRRRHENEAAELRRRYLALERLERREEQTFFREFGERTDTDDPVRRGSAGLTVTYEGQGRFVPGWQAFHENAADITAFPVTSPLVDLRLNATEITAAKNAISAPVIITAAGYETRSVFRDNALDITSVVAERLPGEDRRVPEGVDQAGHKPVPSVCPGVS